MLNSRHVQKYTGHRDVWARFVDIRENLLIRRHPFIFGFLLLAFVLIALLVLRIGYLYGKVDRGAAAMDDNAPTIYYGRSLEIRKGDNPATLHLTQRLQRLSYKQVTGKPVAPGTFSAGNGQIRLFLRGANGPKKPVSPMPVAISVGDGRITALAAPDGAELESVRLEPEEIGRVLSMKLESRHQVTLATVSPHLQNAIIACEDKRFYSHFGIDLLAVCRALAANLRQKRFAQGGSTITQQVAKNFFLSPQKTVARKLREAELALALELRYSKKQILEMYINKIYLGQTGIERIYGVEDASGVYFSKRVKDLTLEEAALLAGIIQAPNRYLLFRNPKAAAERRNKVLARMRHLDMISENEFQQAASAPVRLLAGALPVHQSSYFIDYIQRITRDELGIERLYRTGYRYYTTLDPLMQTFAEEALTRGLEDIQGKAIPAKEPLQAALVAVDPKTGELIAMVGGRSYAQTRFNRAVDARRQPGSAFKPFVLLAALAQSYAGKGSWTLSTRIPGEPITLATPEGPWTPTNYEDKTYGNITLRRVFEDSVNTATVRLANDVGFAEVENTARQAGITSPLRPVPSLPLGSFEVTPMELAYAYATLASGGIRYEPFALYAVTTANADPLINRTMKRKAVFDPKVAYLVGCALEGVLTRGTASEARALKINFPVSGKTGTTNGNRDSWFVSYTPDVVCAVWVGYDGGSDTGLTGAKGALRINARFLRAVYARSTPGVALPPAGIETATIDPDTGFLATSKCPITFEEAYLAGTAPRETCPDHPDSPVMDAVREKMEEAGGFFRRLFE